MLPQQFFTITPEGISRVTINTELCGNAEDKLRALANDTQSITPRVFTVPLAGPVHLATGPNSSTLFARLPMMKIFTRYAAESGNRLRPIFQPAAGSVAVACEWTPPANMAVFFISKFMVQNNRCLYSQSYLVACGTTPQIKGYHRIPLPNSYEDGKLCLGNSERLLQAVQPSIDDPMDKVFSRVVDALHRSEWNSDLLQYSDRVHIDGLFTFDSRTNKSLNPTDTWHTWNRTMSSAVYNALPLNQPQYQAL